jgi:hypothetical protein
VNGQHNGQHPTRACWITHDTGGCWGAGARQLCVNVNEMRVQIEEVAQHVKFSADSVKKGDIAPSPREDRGEVIANLMITYRALEDASMRPMRRVDWSA